MTNKVVALAMLLLVGSAIFAASAAQQQIGPVHVTGFSSITVTRLTQTTDEYTITGPRVYLKTADGTLSAESQSIVMRISSAKGAGLSSLQEAVLTGGVALSSVPDPKNPEKFTRVTANKAELFWATEPKEHAVLSGNVRIEMGDPEKYYVVEEGTCNRVPQPVVLVGDKADINLKSEKDLAPGEQKVRITSDPGRSKLTISLPAKGAERK